MSLYHRHLDHDWQAARRETNYALFGNARGDMKPSREHNWSGPVPTKDDNRAERWRVKYICESVARERGVKSFNQRKMDLAWLRYKELQPLAWNER